jgi:hypothetical protein
MMKFNKYKALGIAIIMISSGVSLKAQYTGGALGGINIANLRGSSVVNNTMVIGYNGGGFVNYSAKDMFTSGIRDILSFQAELRVDQKGATMNFPLWNDTIGDDPSYTFGDQEFLFTYVQVPIFAKFNFGQQKGLNYFGEAGLFGAGLFGLTVDGEKKRDHDLKANTDQRNYRDEFEGYDFGVLIGAGISIPFGGRNSHWRALINGRYSLGLANIVSSNIGTPNSKAPVFFEEYLKDVKTSTISLSLGVSYQF